MIVGPFELEWPEFQMGAVSSADLASDDERLIFDFYHTNRDRYRRVVDFGANIGLHTIIMARCGFEVRSFEPDPVHVAQLKRCLILNDAETDLYEAAVSLEDGEAVFVRVKGNTTSNHLQGAKTPYGEVETFTVRTEAAAKHLAWADLAKIDIEGHEAALLTGLPLSTWDDCDAVVEVGTAENAAAIFDYFAGSAVKLYAQKIGWGQVTQLSDMPTSYREGSLFLSAQRSFH